MSLDHQHIAYTIDTKGDETYTCYISNISSGKIMVNYLILLNFNNH